MARKSLRVCEDRQRTKDPPLKLQKLATKTIVDGSTNPNFLRPVATIASSARARAECRVVTSESFGAIFQEANQMAPLPDFPRVVNY